MSPPPEVGLAPSQPLSPKTETESEGTPSRLPLAPPASRQDLVPFIRRLREEASAGDNGQREIKQLVHDQLFHLRTGKELAQKKYEADVAEGRLVGLQTPATQAFIPIGDHPRDPSRWANSWHYPPAEGMEAKNTVAEEAVNSETSSTAPDPASSIGTPAQPMAPWQKWERQRRKYKHHHHDFYALDVNAVQLRNAVGFPRKELAQSSIRVRRTALGAVSDRTFVGKVDMDASIFPIGAFDPKKRNPGRCTLLSPRQVTEWMELFREAPTLLGSFITQNAELSLGTDLPQDSDGSSSEEELNGSVSVAHRSLFANNFRGIRRLRKRIDQFLPLDTRSSSPGRADNGSSFSPRSHPRASSTTPGEASSMSILPPRAASSLAFTGREGELSTDDSDSNSSEDSECAMCGLGKIRVQHTRIKGRLAYTGALKVAAACRTRMHNRTIDIRNFKHRSQQKLLATLEARESTRESVLESEDHYAQISDRALDQGKLWRMARVKPQRKQRTLPKLQHSATPSSLDSPQGTPTPVAPSTNAVSTPISLNRSPFFATPSSSSLAPAQEAPPVSDTEEPMDPELQARRKSILDDLEPFDHKAHQRAAEAVEEARLEKIRARELVLKQAKLKQRKSFWNRSSKEVHQERFDNADNVLAYQRLILYLDALSLPVGRRQVELVASACKNLREGVRLTPKSFGQWVQMLGESILEDREAMKIVHFLRLEVGMELEAFLKAIRSWGWTLSPDLQLLDTRIVKEAQQRAAEHPKEFEAKFQQFLRDSGVVSPQP